MRAVQECVRATELLSACLQSAFFTDKPDWELIRKMESKFGHKRQRALAPARLQEGQTQTPRGPIAGPPLRPAPPGCLSRGIHFIQVFAERRRRPSAGSTLHPSMQPDRLRVNFPCRDPSGFSGCTAQLLATSLRSNTDLVMHKTYR